MATNIPEEVANKLRATMGAKQPDYSSQRHYQDKPVPVRPFRGSTPSAEDWKLHSQDFPKQGISGSVDDYNRRRESMPGYVPLKPGYADAARAGQIPSATVLNEGWQKYSESLGGTGVNAVQRTGFVKGPVIPGKTYPAEPVTPAAAASVGGAAPAASAGASSTLQPPAGAAAAGATESGAKPVASPAVTSGDMISAGNRAAGEAVNAKQIDAILGEAPKPLEIPKFQIAENKIALTPTEKRVEQAQKPLLSDEAKSSLYGAATSATETENVKLPDEKKYWVQRDNPANYLGDDDIKDKGDSKAWGKDMEALVSKNGLRDSGDAERLGTMARPWTYFKKDGTFDRELFQSEYNRSQYNTAKDTMARLANPETRDSVLKEFDLTERRYAADAAADAEKFKSRHGGYAPGYAEVMSKYYGERQNRFNSFVGASATVVDMYDKQEAEFSKRDLENRKLYGDNAQKNADRKQKEQAERRTAANNLYQKIVEIEEQNKRAEADRTATYNAKMADIDAANARQLSSNETSVNIANAQGQLAATTSTNQANATLQSGERGARATLGAGLEAGRSSRFGHVVGSMGLVGAARERSEDKTSDGSRTTPEERARNEASNEAAEAKKAYLSNPLNKPEGAAAVEEEAFRKGLVRRGFGGAAASVGGLPQYKIGDTAKGADGIMRKKTAEGWVAIGGGQ